MMNFQVDKAKCIKCKICISECPVLIIDGKSEYPEIKDGKEKNCLECQHCLAVCPEGAISIFGKVPGNSIPADARLPEALELENLMQLRRSVRKFQKQEIAPKLIQHIIAMAAYAPTGKNENAVQFTVVDNRADMAKLRKLAYGAIRQAYQENSLPQLYLYLNKFREVWESKGVDIIFRDAPHLLITSVPKTGTEPLTDGVIAATYFELLANSYGLGTMWDGFAKYIFAAIAPALTQTTGIPENHEIAAVMIFGKPGVKFARSVQNDSPNIKRVAL